MKKTLTALSVIVLLFAVILTGCGDKEDGQISTTASTTTTTSTTAGSTAGENSTSGTSDEENLEDKITSAITELSERME